MITRPTNGSKDIHFLDQDGQEEKDHITSLTNALSCKYAMLPNCLCPQLVGRAAAEPALGPRAWPSDSPIAAGRARHCCHYARASFSKLIQCILCMLTDPCFTLLQLFLQLFQYCVASLLSFLSDCTLHLAPQKTATNTQQVGPCPSSDLWVGFLANKV